MKVDHMAQAAQSTASDHDLGEAYRDGSQKSSDQKTSAVEGGWYLVVEIYRYLQGFFLSTIPNGGLVGLGISGCYQQYDSV